MSIILSAKNINRDFKVGDTTVNALKNVNVEIEQGKLTVLRGPSGSGKTTLINILGALDYPTSSDGIIFNNKDITKLSQNERDDLRRYEMAFVFQSVALMSNMTAYENVEFGLRLAKYPYAERDARTKTVMKNVNLDKRMYHRPTEMSGGEQQRTAIARAIAHKPKIIFADEPTAELDSVTALHIVKLFKELVEKENMTIVMTTHDPGMMEVADVVYTLEDGEIIE